MITVTLRIFVFLSFFAFAFNASATEQSNEEFTNFINDNTDGSSFDQAVALKDTCDYKECKSRDCLREVFNKTVFAQELKYMSDKFGEIGEDWDVEGYDEVNYYTLTGDNYYDDLGIQVFATGEKKVIHFDITSSVNALRKKEFNLF